MSRSLATLLALILAAPAIAQDAPKPKPAEAVKKARPPRGARPDHADSGRLYMGREIADVMSFHGADWLVRAEREDEERPEQMLDALKIRPGDTVADVGAGVGYHQRPPEQARRPQWHGPGDRHPAADARHVARQHEGGRDRQREAPPLHRPPTPACPRGPSIWPS